MTARIALLFLAGLFQASCGSRTGMTSGPSEAGHVVADGDPFTLLEVEVVGDSLITLVRHGGGFRDHTYTLVSGGAATKSLPRQQPIRLLHDADGDMGRALIEQRRAFDLRPFRDPSQPAIRLRLEGWDEWLEYRYGAGG